MRRTYGFLANELTRQRIRLSARRAKVLEYLCSHLDHPTVDEIYANLLKEVPTLSKTTVYNTLHVLIDAGLLRELTIDDHQVRYDIVTEDHGHLKCVECGAIFDFKVNPGSLASDELAGFKVLDRNVYLKGICPTCISTVNHHPQIDASPR